jgi:hypothetical protein
VYKRDGQRHATADLFDTLTATLLMHFKYLMQEYSANNKIVAQLICVARDCGYSIEQLEIWGELIRSDWNRINFEDGLLKEDSESTIKYLERQVSSMRGEINSLNAQLHVANNKLDEVIKQNKEMLTYLRNSAVTPISPTKKRKLVSNSSNSHDADDFPPSEAEREPHLNESPHEPEKTDADSSLNLSMANQEAPNALKLLTPYTESFVELAGFELLDCLKKAMKHRWLVTRAVPVKQDQRQTKSKIMKVIDFVADFVLTEEEIKKWARGFPPKRVEPGFVKWEQDLHDFCKDVERRTMASVEAEERTVGLNIKKGSNKISGICKRLEDIEKKGGLQKKKKQ